MFKNLISRMRSEPNRESRKVRKWEARNLLYGVLSTDILYASGDRLFQRGLITESERDEFTYKWFKELEGAPYTLGYVDLKERWSVIHVCQECYSLSKWAMDALIWHEMAHLLSREGHDGALFKHMISRDRFNRTKLVIMEILMLIRWY